MVPKTNFCILLLISCVTAESGDVYSSTAQVEMFVKTQGKLLETLEEYYDSQINIINTIETYLNESKEEHRQIKESEKKYKNPICVYRLIKRLSKDLKYVEHLIKQRRDFILDSTVGYPTKDDLAGTIRGLIRLQDVYQIQASDLAKGILKGNFSAEGKPYIEQVTPMRGTDCYVVSNFAGEILGPEEKVAWLIQSLEILRTQPCDDCLAEQLEVVDRIWKGYYLMANTNETIKWLKERRSLHPQDPDILRYYATEMYLKENPKYLAQLKTKRDQQNLSKEIKNQATNLTDEEKMYVEDDSYKALCRGALQKIDHSLTCHYKYGPHPFLQLARVKTELLHRAPDVILYRDVISDAEIRQLQEKVRPKLQRVGVANKTKTETRIVKSWSFNDLHHSSVAKISRRLSMMTNLVADTAEDLQVSNYGVGGYYTPHHDYYGRYPHFIGRERIATALLFLSDVEQGGATVFIRLNLTVFPEKGAALFWWNLHLSGDGDVNTLHAGCPVLRGSKWISNKWFHVEGQELIRPCYARRRHKQEHIISS